MGGLSQDSGRQATLIALCSSTVAISSNLEHRPPRILDTMTFGTKSGTVGIVLTQRLRTWCLRLCDLLPIIVGMVHAIETLRL